MGEEKRDEFWDRTVGLYVDAYNKQEAPVVGPIKFNRIKPRLYRTSAVASVLGLTAATVRKMAKEGRLTSLHWKDGMGAKRFSQGDVFDYAHKYMKGGNLISREFIEMELHLAETRLRAEEKERRKEGRKNLRYGQFDSTISFSVEGHVKDALAAIFKRQGRTMADALREAVYEILECSAEGQPEPCEQRSGEDERAGCGPDESVHESGGGEGEEPTEEA